MAVDWNRYWDGIAIASAASACAYDDISALALALTLATSLDLAPVVGTV